MPTSRGTNRSAVPSIMDCYNTRGDIISWYSSENKDLKAITYKSVYSSPQGKYNIILETYKIAFVYFCQYQ